LGALLPAPLAPPEYLIPVDGYPLDAAPPAAGPPLVGPPAPPLAPTTTADPVMAVQFVVALQK
jgi:hypothetical protein